MVDPEFHADRATVIGLVQGMGRASTKLAATPVEKRLLAKMGPNALAGAHIMRSIELMLMQGHNLADTMARHRQMIEIIQKVMMGMASSANLPDSDTAFPPVDDVAVH
mgnify:FL=1